MALLCLSQFALKQENNMRFTELLLLPVLMLAALSAWADGDTEAGRLVYERTCAACHGAAGQGNVALHAPRLTHLTPVYIVEQLQKFKSGVRVGDGASEAARQMAGMAATLPDEQTMLDVALFVATLDGGVSSASVDGDATLGADYFNQLCGACHGAQAQGNPALRSPPLAGADDWYMVAQLQAFRSGARGAHPDDRTGRQMRAMAALLPDEQAIRDVVSFAHALAE